MAGQEAITTQYDRIAPWYRALSPLFLINPPMRRKAVAALTLGPGDTVLEVGVGSGRNLPYLLDAVGTGGGIVGVDLSPGMLAEARRVIARRGASNVCLIEADASTVDLADEHFVSTVRLDRGVDAVLFSLSYSAMPEPVRAPALARAWEALRPGGRLVMLDTGIARSRLRPLVAPIGKQLIKLGPGDPLARPWDDLAAYGEVVSEPVLLDIYMVYSVVKQTPGTG
jgi:demethylmenaquinone methyltransferase/2-methoxy-6-polyprenyl-1,4-benzoquinol methylase